LHDAGNDLPKGVSGDTEVIWLNWSEQFDKDYRHAGHLEAKYLDWDFIAAYAVKEGSTEGVNTKE
jgi:hypothetical protein